ncbi:hypothetical protein M758_4G265900 [Ceratodon purpureus]|nr:hypothetical protein M758_4G265900 [Ceratodon purpureus]
MSLWHAHSATLCAEALLLSCPSRHESGLQFVECIPRFCISAPVAGYCDEGEASSHISYVVWVYSAWIHLVWACLCRSKLLLDHDDQCQSTLLGGVYRVEP